MNGKKASLMATDPPYLVDYSGGNHPASKGNQGKPGKDKQWDEYEDPEASVEFYRNFLTLSLEHLKPNTAVYQWHAYKRQALVEQAWREIGLLVHQQIIWVKARGVLTQAIIYGPMSHASTAGLKAINLQRNLRPARGQSDSLTSGVPP